MSRDAPFPEPCIAASNVFLRGPNGPLFDPVSFCLNRGESLCLVGPNGSGKSLLVRTIALGTAPKPFALGGLLSTPRSASPETFYLPQLQAPEIHLPYCLGEIAALNSAGPCFFPWFDESMARRAWNLASGGERMRALLARALASEATLLLLDEPFNHLDVATAEAVRTTIQAETKGPRRRAFLLVSHAEERADGEHENAGFPLLRLRRTRQEETKPT